MTSNPETDQRWHLVVGTFFPKILTRHELGKVTSAGEGMPIPDGRHSTAYKVNTIEVYNI